MRTPEEQNGRSVGVYVTALEPGSGKSAVVLGLFEVLSRRVGRTAFFRPVVAAADPPDPDIELVRRRYHLPQTYQASFALTAADLTTGSSRNELLGRVWEGWSAVAASADAVVVEGTDLTGSPATEVDLNAAVAVHLSAPVVLVVGGRGRTAPQVLDAVRRDLAALAERNCEVLGVVCNRVDPATLEAVRAGLASAASGVPTGALPELPLLAAPTVGEVAAALDAEVVAGNPRDARPIERVIVGAMGLPHFLGRVADADLVITPGDRADLVAGTLAAHLSGTFPAVAGLVLTGGTGEAVEPVVRELACGLAGTGVPVLAVAQDTYDTVSAVNRVRAALRPGDDRKLAAALRLFEDHVDTDAMLAGLDVTRPTRLTPLMFEQRLLERARADRRHIVLPEGDDERILRAAEQLLLRGVVDLTLLGPERDVRSRAKALGLTLPDVRIVDPATSPWREEFARVYAEQRRHRGVALPLALDLMADGTYFGTMMVRRGGTNGADGMVSGATHTTAHTIRPAFEVIRTAPGVSLVSSAFLMCLPDHVVVYADCAVVPNPDPEQLAEIALSAAGTAARFGIEPRVAMLSYSTGESGAGADVDLVRQATALVRRRRPELPVAGPIQYDAAVDTEIARMKLPDDEVAGRANVFVFPDLNTGNNTYKAVQRTAGVVAIGPILQGLAKPVNDLSRGATVADIVTTVAITAIQAQG
ncbi:MAG: phosphate acetyltransferase [Pseudonocardia sp.]|uniref:phosphate acetyltransferase n=1 Tax=unclassified Pseudonocardia TaxID=2619320 RepID=UPI00086A46C3|nr:MULTISPECIES: phosphate acetyltransferase [unclassified Pseudonocardia]MBN9112472.1 phosphate acetyltransferase [Pseudonocardia sp.]ODU27268.1 MAG: phosphate acetyltransferase [Pseudonocardia sp. SCN 72-51]ODV08882.1 MAG: phosphate acetyltransferase [Pseudonocardia sp. SCN 73-27]